jgi:hypothetical protein
MDVNEIIEKYTMPSGKVFYNKMMMDLGMWLDFAHDYGYDKKGIMQLRRDLDELKELRKQTNNK